MLERSALDFFERWSRFVCKYPKFRTWGEPLPSHERAELRLKLSELQGSPEVSKEDLDEAEQIAKEMANEVAKEDYGQLRESQPRYRDKDEAYPLLQNNDLWDLMRIPFSASVAATAASERVATVAVPDSGAALAGGTPRPPGPLAEPQKAATDIVGNMPRAVQSAIAASLRKPVDQLTADDLLAVRSIGLNGADVSDVSPLALLPNLQTVSLSNTQISDISPIGNLWNLRALYLTGTRVGDISPLANLLKLQALELARTQVNDVSPLANLKELRALELSGTQVSDVLPLADLQNLVRLDLAGTRVADISPLANLENLISLDLRNTEVADVLPLKNLPNLYEVKLRCTRVSPEGIVRLRGLRPALNIDGER
jgi:Leucine-rich repeat (LRR) protein